MTRTNGSTAVRRGSSPLAWHAAGDRCGGTDTAALHRILAAGADVDDLTDVVRTMQHEIIYNVCQLLDDPVMLSLRPDSDGMDDPPPGELKLGWKLMAVHAAQPAAEARPIGGAALGARRARPQQAGWRTAQPTRFGKAAWGQPLCVRRAVAQAHRGDRLTAIKTWRAATGSTLSVAKAAIDALLTEAEN